jgi:excisionase family DNA binding protein
LVSDIRTITTGQVATYCQVSRATIVNWIKQGKLKAHTTPGGRYRILVSDVLDLLESYGMPIDPRLEGSHIVGKEVLP